MFINNKTDRPAWLVSQDLDVTYSLDADKAHPHHTMPAGAFFAAHREATADEIEEHTPRAAAPAPKPKEPAVPKPKAPKFKAPAPKAKAGKGGVRKVSKGRSSPQRAKPPAVAPAAPALAPPTTREGGEPHGE